MINWNKQGGRRNPQSNTIGGMFAWLFKGSARGAPNSAYIVVLAAESRALVLAAAYRILILAAESRAVTLAAESRVVEA